jgi:uncharacterized protein YutE (UPF0331/DUF86 family)
MNSDAQAAAVLEDIVPELEAEGFEVITCPPRRRLPPFLQSYSPDAIARREDKNLAIEVLRKGAPSEKNLDRLRQLLAGHRDWELRVYWINPANTPEPIEPASAKDIAKSIELIEGLGRESLFAPALVMAWATLEGLGRALLPDRFPRPQTPGRLVEVLAGEGYVTPSEADRLRPLAKVRNQLIHGGLRARVGSKDIESFTSVLRTLLELLQSEQASA